MEDLYFTEEHKMLRGMVRDFARNEVKPLAQELDEKGGFPYESVKKMAELGLMGIPSVSYTHLTLPTNREV